MKCLSGVMLGADLSVDTESEDFKNFYDAIHE